MAGDNCSTGCTTRDHATYGECMRSKGAKVAYAGTHANGGGDATRQRRWDANIKAYRDARRQGIQPRTSKRSDIEKAVRISNETGKPYNALKAER